MALMQRAIEQADEVTGLEGAKLVEDDEQFTPTVCKLNSGMIHKLTEIVSGYACFILLLQPVWPESE
jgi:hypothetical protein